MVEVGKEFTVAVTLTFLLVPPVVLQTTEPLIVPTEALELTRTLIVVEGTVPDVGVRLTDDL